ncbi:MAG TPA: peptidoglycan recognition family protein [Tepidisphaeraceae bacterium]
MPSPNFAGPQVAQQVTPFVPPVEPPLVRTTIKPTNAPAAWTPAANAEKRQWKWIVVHHSAGASGGAAAFDKFHREVRGWDQLGYHFVIGNGSDTADGLVEVGGRWPIQKHGAHAKTPDNQYNDHGIGICLVGNFNSTRPTAKQMQSLTKLVAFLADTYKIKQSNIIGHKNTGKDTDCPGANFDIAQLRANIAKARGVVVLHDTATATDEELMLSSNR